MPDTDSTTPPTSPSTVVLTPPGSQTSESGNEETYSAHFPLHDRADLVIRSSDGILFATKKFHLQAASPVFEDALELGSSSDGERRDGRPILRLSESGSDLELFLRLLHRDHGRSNELITQLDLAALVQLSPLVEKYATSTLSFFLYNYVLGLLYSTWKSLGPNESAEGVIDGPVSATVLALGLIHEQPLGTIMGWRTIVVAVQKEEGHRVLTRANEADPEERTNGWRFPGVEDIPLELLARIPLRHVQTFAKVMSKLSNKVDYSWTDAREEMFNDLTWLQVTFC